MTSAHERIKQPEIVRRQLLDSAARLAVTRGLGAVTVQAVAAAAGVTKGGLFHHFPTKQALLEAVCTDLLSALDSEIDRHLAQTGDTPGCFTRAYILAALDDERDGSPWNSLSVTVLADPSLRDLWAWWIRDRLIRHAATDSGVALEALRLAADGAWLADLTEIPSATGTSRAALRAHLLSLIEGSCP